MGVFRATPKSTVDGTILPNYDASWSMWLAVISITLVSGWLLFRFVGNPSPSHIRNDDDDYQVIRAPKSNQSMWTTLSRFGSNQLPWFLMDEWQRLDYPPAFALNMPLVRHGCWVVTQAAVARHVLTDPTSEKIGVLAGTKGKISNTVSIARALTQSSYWKLIRKAMAPAFSSRQVHRMNAICRRHVETWIHTTLEPLVDGGGTLDPAREMTRLTTRVICEAAFEYNVSSDQVTEFLHNMELALKEFVQKQLFNQFRATRLAEWCIPSVRQAHEAARWLRQFCHTMLDAFRQRHTSSTTGAYEYQGPSTTQSVLRLLVEQSQLTDAERIGEMVTFLLAGYDTTGYSLGNVLCLLAEHTNVQDTLRTALRHAEHEYNRAQSEDKDTVARDNHQGNQLSLSDAATAWSRCAYLQYVLKENFRLLPVAAVGPNPRCLAYDLYVTAEDEGRDPVILPNGTGRTTTSVKEEGNSTTPNQPPKGTKVIRIPKGSTIFMPQLLMHRNPQDFGSDADTFRPERWAPSNNDDNNNTLKPTTTTTSNRLGGGSSSSSNRDLQHHLLPFSLGSRNCIAQSLATAELSSVLPRLIRHYAFEVEQAGQPDYFLTLKLAHARLSVRRVPDDNDP